MSLWTHLATAVRDYFGTWQSSDPALASIWGRGPAKAGVNVTEETSLNLSAVWACVQLIAGAIGTLPLTLYRRQADGDREAATDLKLYRLLHDEPNNEMSSAAFFRTLQAHVLLWGNAFALIRRDNAGRIAELYPVEPWRVMARRRSGLSGPLFYAVSNRDGTMAELDPSEIVHVPGLSANGIWGYSVVGKARDSFGLTLAQEYAASAFQGNGSSYGGVLSPKAHMSPTAREELRDSLARRHQGPERAGQLLILPADFTFSPLAMSGRDAQFLQQREFQLSEIARWFGVPPHLIGDTTKSTTWGTGIAQQTVGFLEFTLRPWLVAWERELNRKLISPLERNLQLIEFNVAGLERGDIATRKDFYESGLRAGWLLRNEVRRLENLPKLPWLDEPLVPVNMTTAEQIAKPPPPPPAALPPPVEEEDEDEEDEEDEENARALKALEAQVSALVTREAPAVDLDPMLARIGELAFRLDELKAQDVTPELTSLRAQLEALVDGQGALRTKLEATEQARTETQARLTRLVIPLRAIVEGIVRDLVKRERDRARRAAQSPEKLGAWIVAFYEHEEDYAVKRLREAVSAYAEMMGQNGDVAERIRRQIALQIDDARAGLARLLATPPADLAAAVDALTARWEAERPTALADALTQEVAHAAADPA